MIKILFLIDSLAGGGAEKGMVNLINALDPKKYKIYVSTMSSGFARAKEIKNDIELRVYDKKSFLVGGKKSTDINVYGLNNVFEGSSLRRLINFGNNDVEILFMDSPLIKSVSAASDSTVKIVRLASDYSKMFNEFMLVDTEFGIREHFNYYKKLDYVVSPALYSAKTFSQVTGVEKNVVCVYNVNSRDELVELASQKVTDIKKEKFTICYSGRITKDKGTLRLINVAKKLNADGFDYDLWIIGEGADTEKVKKKIEEEKLTNIKLLGYKTNPFKYMILCDLYVSCSYREGLSNSAKEAMLLGIPSVVTDCSGMAEIFGENSEYGLITDNTDEALYEGIKKMLTEKETYDYYKNSVLLRQDFFDSSKLIKKWEELFIKGE